MNPSDVIGIAALIVTVIGIVYTYLSWKETKKQTQLAKKPSKKVEQKGENVSQQNVEINSPEQGEFHIQQIGNVIVQPSKEIVVPKEIDKSQYRAKPTPQEIIKNIEESSPFMKDVVRKNYIDLKVKWELRLDSLTHKRDNIYKLVFFSVSTSQNISCEVDISKFPEFKIMKNNQIVRVFGEISTVSVTGLFLELNNCYFEFDFEDLPDTKRDESAKSVVLLDETVYIKDSKTKDNEEITILKLLNQSAPSGRTVRGICTDTGFDIILVQKKLDELVNQKLVEVRSNTKGTRWSITAKGRDFLKH